MGGGGGVEQTRALCSDFLGPQLDSSATLSKVIKII